MSKRHGFFLAAAALLSPMAAHAAPRTVVLSVEKATCTLCAPIVKRALTKVQGVKSVRIVEASGEKPAVATVVYDDAVTNVAKLTATTTNAGFPSRPIK
jgi:mercuric ion binding protein